MPKLQAICPACNTRYRVRGVADLVCNCSVRLSGHALYPVCQLESGATWRECLCAEVDPVDVPCISCEALAESAEGCRKCGEILVSRVVDYAAFRVRTKAS